MRFIHQTGAIEYNQVQSAYADCKANAKVAPFFDDMPALFAEADVVVCRAGASAVAELNAAGRAAVLVPYPFAADQHQQANALDQQQARAARVVNDGDLTAARLVDEIEQFWENPALLERMEGAAHGRARPGAADRAADLMEELARISENE